MKLIVMLSLTSIVLMAKPCSEINECIKKVSKLTNKTYILDKDIKGTINTTDNFELTAENADYFLSEMLNILGYSRVPSDSADFTIINARDVRYVPTKLLTYGKDEIPKNHDHISVTIKLKNKYLTSDLSRNFRPFMSRYGRIIDVPKTGTLIINDTGKNIHRLIGLVNQLDKKPSEEDIEEYKKAQREKSKIAQLKAKNCSDKDK